MANISENLSTVKQSLIDIKNVIIDKGVTPTGNITTYAEAINQLCLCGESVEATPLYIENVSNSEGVFKLYKDSSPTYTPNLIYRIGDNGEWFEYDFTTLPNITVPSGSKIYLKGNNPNGFTQGISSAFCRFDFNQKYDIGGYITSLLALDNFNTITDIPQYCFCRLFSQQGNLLNAKDLITDNIVNVGDSTFNFCFYGCTSLVTAPDFSNITTVGSFGFVTCFQNCSSLTTAPDFSNVITIDDRGFKDCFKGCNKLQVIYTPNIATWVENTFENWVGGVASTGVVFKSESLEIPTGTSGIPTGWITIIKN